MKNFILFISFIFSFLITGTGCKKETTYKNAIIKYGGDPALDGCGWYIVVDSAEYKPVNLSAQYEINNKDVKISYQLLSSKAPCGFSPDHFTEIRLTHIMDK